MEADVKMLPKVLLIFVSIFGLIECSVVIRKPLQCESYSHEKCVKEKKCDYTIEICENDSDKPSSCFVLWLNETGSPEIKMKGCFSYNVACDQPDCIDYNVEKKNDLNFCCCQGSRCNSDQKWIPTTTEATEVEVPTKNISNENFMLWMIALFSVLLIIAITVAFIFYRKKKQSMFEGVPTMEPELNSSSPCLALRKIVLKDIKASGRFGAVWQGEMPGADDVAVKIFSMLDKDSWMTEQDIFKLPRMRHPNILEFIGVEKRIDSQEFWLITAYHSNGSLCDYLKSYTITWLELCKIAESMSRGLMHLHEEISGNKTEGLKPAIAHRDFKSKNVLLKNDLTACIADFGLAMVFQPGKPCGDTHGQVGTRRYMAPEVLEGAINFTRDAFLRIDVYACGLVLWEMVSRCTVHGGQVIEYALPFESELGSHPSLEQMQESVVMKKLRPSIPEQWRTHAGLSAICDTMEECWDHDAEARLSSSCVMERVSQHTRYPTTPLLIETNTDTPVKDSSNSL